MTTKPMSEFGGLVAIQSVRQMEFEPSPEDTPDTTDNSKVARLEQSVDQWTDAAHDLLARVNELTTLLREAPCCDCIKVQEWHDRVEAALDTTDAKGAK